jgi:hypothetical protein
MVCEDCKRITAPESGLFTSPSSASSRPHGSPWDARRHHLVPKGADKGIGPINMPLKPSLEALRASAQSGCSCCGFFETFTRASSVSLAEDSHVYLERTRKSVKIYESLAEGDCVALRQTGLVNPIQTFNICTKGISALVSTIRAVSR